MKILSKILIFTLSLFCLSESVAAKQEIMIAVAANMSYVFKDIIIEFNKIHPNIEVKTVIGSSGKLTAQIINGAPFEIFLSANKGYPEILWKKKIAVSEPEVYAKGLLILLFEHPQKSDTGLKILNENIIKTVAVSNIKLAPYGTAAWKVLIKSKLLQKIKHKLVYAQNNAQTVQYTVTVADAGFIAKSAIFAPTMKKYNIENKFWFEIDSTLYSPIEQSAALLSENKMAGTFYHFLFSQKVKLVLEKWGYRI